MNMMKRLASYEMAMHSLVASIAEKAIGSPRCVSNLAFKDKTIHLTWGIVNRIFMSSCPAKGLFLLIVGV